MFERLIRACARLTRIEPVIQFKPPRVLVALAGPRMLVPAHDTCETGLAERFGLAPWSDPLAAHWSALATRHGEDSP